MLDDNGQPKNARFNSRHRSERDVDELIGLCKGMVADEQINQAEANFLKRWLELHEDVAFEWPGDILSARISSMLSDGVLDKTEEIELFRLLTSITGGDASKLNAQSLTTGLPLNEPSPPVLFADKRFCFTGKFIFGTRQKCEEQVSVRGGIVADGVTKDLDFLVIGIVGSRDWVHSSFGRKIQKAVEYRESKKRLAIVAEEHFVKAIRP